MKSRPDLMSEIESLEPMVLMSAGIFGTDAGDVLSTAAEGEYLAGLGGDDVLSGLARDNDLYGGAGDDVLQTTAGGNNIYGGDGTDTIRYDGDRSAFSIGMRGDGRIEIRDANRVDLIQGVEKFQFGSELLEATELFADDNTAPAFLSTQHPVVRSGQTFVLDVIAVDADGDSVSLSLGTDSDSQLFEIDSDTGVLRFRDAPDVNAPLDRNGDNVYDLTLVVTDGKTSVQETLWVSVIEGETGGEVNTPPEFVGLPENNVFVKRDFSDLSPSLVVGTLTAEDADGDYLSYVIEDIAGTDLDRFNFSPARQLVFKAPPDFDNPTDVNRDNDYELVVSVFDGEAATTEYITVRVTEAEFTPPAFVNLAEDAEIDVQFRRQSINVRAVDPDGRPIRYFVGGVDSEHWFIGRDTGLLQRLGDFGAVNPDANGDGVFEITVIASDGDDVSSRDVRIRPLAPNVIGDNNAPQILDVDEDEVIKITSGLRPVMDFDAADADGNPVSWFLGGPDAQHFVFDEFGQATAGSQGRLSFRESPDVTAPADADSDGVYELFVVASDGRASDSRNISVEVEEFRDGENTAPVFVNLPFVDISDSIRVTERSQFIADFEAYDADGDPVSFEFAATARRFTLDPETGELRWRFSSYLGPGRAGFDVSSQVVVRVTDGDLSTDVRVPIRNVNFDENLNVAPEFTNIQPQQVFSLTEGETFVVDLEAADANTGQTPLFALSGDDAHWFQLLEETGELVLINQLSPATPLDRDGDNRYELTVSVHDQMLFNSEDIVVEISAVTEDPLTATV